VQPPFVEQTIEVPQTPVFAPSQPSAPVNPAPEPQPVSVSSKTFAAGYYDISGLGRAYMQPSLQAGVYIITQIAPTSSGKVYEHGYYNVAGLGLSYIQPAQSLVASAGANTGPAPRAPTQSVVNPSSTLGNFAQAGTIPANAGNTAPTFSAPGFGGNPRPAPGGNQTPVPPAQGGNSTALPAIAGGGAPFNPGSPALGGSQTPALGGNQTPATIAAPRPVLGGNQTPAIGDGNNGGGGSNSRRGQQGGGGFNPRGGRR
jgi:hypothetical protein